MDLIHTIEIVCVLLFAAPVIAQPEHSNVETVLWSDIDQFVQVGKGSTILNNTPIDRTIFTFTSSQHYVVKYNGLDTTMQRTYISLSAFFDRPVQRFVLVSNGMLTIFPKSTVPPDIVFFTNPLDVPLFEEDIKNGIISSYLEVAVCGMVLMMLLYILGKYAQLRTPIYLYYALYLLFTLLFLTIVLFYTTQTWMEMPLLRGFIHHSTQAVSHACYFQFVRYFIQTRQHQPFFDKLLNWVSILSVVYIILDGLGMLSLEHNYPYRTIWDAVQVFYLIFGVTSLAVWIARSPSVFKNYLLIGTTALLIAGVVGLLVLFMPHWIESLPAPLNIQVFYFRLGILIEIISFSLGLGYMQRLDEINRVQAETKLEKEHKQMLSFQELDQLKTKFFSNITHEFRTPLTLIQGPANELLEKTNDPEAKKLLTMIKNNSARLLTLINQLLDLAKLDAREVKLTMKPIRLDVLLKTTVSQFTSLASSRLIHFEWRILTEAHTVLMDEEKVETILTNLVSNALKFTPARGIVLVSATYTNQLLEIEVKDSGRGIPAEKLPHIFDRFYQVEATDSSHSEGTGIGLALVKEYVELMKGTIQIESQVGVGTSFKVSIALASAPPMVVEEKVNAIDEHIPEESNGGDDQLPLILIVEDNQDIRSFIKTCLGNQYRYSEARHGREGLDKAQHEIPDIIISDLMMPEMDGLELCGEIKKDVRTNHIPFIMLTAKAADENKMEGLQTGADDYLIKPFNKAELALKVHNLVLLREKLQAHLKGTLLSQATPIVVTSASELFVAKAKAFIEANMKDETLSVETLAAELNLGREQCYRKMSALTGFSPSVFIRKLRMQKAAQLLASKWGPISQIAYEVGFENPSYFGRAFKEEFGKPPSDYVG
jgi:signal transduction histidine kinase/DNA-binding response OmpR family regulator